MGWLGKMVGGTIGFALGGPLGGIAGAVFGHAFDRSEERTFTDERQRLSRRRNPSSPFLSVRFPCLPNCHKPMGVFPRKRSHPSKNSWCLTLI